MQPKYFFMKRFFSFWLSLWVVCVAYPCTSFIISGRATPSGRPLMFKHRDTGELNNRVAYFSGPKYAFIGLVNAPVLSGEVWAGMNEAGFCIMNTASYNLREDSLDCAMDREGELMYHALGICATLEDFEAWLQTYPQPWGVEANFGVIDAQGGAAYYEMNNHRYIKYDVNAEATGYRVVTNFSFAGRYEQYEGYERYLTASAIMQEAFSREQEMSAVDAINLFSRQYRHELLGLRYDSLSAPQYAVDQDFIPRRITSAVVVFEGVSSAHHAHQSVMWTALGYPACAVAVPMLVHRSSIPGYMLQRDASATEGEGLHCQMCDASLQLKAQYVFPLSISNGQRYVHLGHVLRGVDGGASLLSRVQQVERRVVSDFERQYSRWLLGELSDAEFYEWYSSVSSGWMDVFSAALGR